MPQQKSVYLVLDMQNDLAHEDGPSGSGPLGEQVRERELISKTAAAIDKARKAGILVGFVRVGFIAGYPECPPASPVFGPARKNGIFKLGSWGTEIHPSLEQKEGDLQVTKNRVSPFYATNLVAQLSAQNVSRIYCSGVSTQAVVQATVRDAHDRDYEIIVLEDCCAAHDLVEHQNSMQSLVRFCVSTSSEAVVFENPS